MASSLGLRFGGLIDLRSLIDTDAPVYKIEKENEYRRSYKKSREESEVDESKRTFFMSDEDSAVKTPAEEEDVLEFDDAIDFDDEDAWHSVPRSHCRGRFLEYRRLSRQRLAAQQEETLLTRQKANAKSLKLKSQFNEFKEQWEEERRALNLSLKEAETETEDAKRQAEMAVSKLEEMYDRIGKMQEMQGQHGDKLQAHLGQLEVDKAKLETRVDELQHETAVLQQLLKQANKEKEEAEKKVAEATTAVSTPQLAEELFEDASSVSTDADIPFPDDASDNPLSGPGLHLADHPIVGEFMRTYQHIMRAKTRLSSLLSESDFYKDVSANLSSLDEQDLNRDSRITPQIEDLGRNLTFVSDQIFLLVENVVMHLEKHQQQQHQQNQHQQQQSVDDYKLKHQALTDQMAELQSKYDSIARLLADKERQLLADVGSRDAEIRDLQQSVQSLTKEVERMRAEQQYELQNSLMFTKLDAERNAKSLKKALASRRIPSSSYQSTLEAMESYGDVSAKRLNGIARHLLHRRRVLQLGRDIVEEFGDSPDLLERLQRYDSRVRRRQEAEADRLREQRLRMAADLVDTFEFVSESAGIFLIRPVLSLQHRQNLRQHLHSVADTNRKRQAARTTQETRRVSVCEEEGEGEAGDRLPALAGRAVARQDTQELWSMAASTDLKSLPAGIDRTLLNTPRLLEMDVNKILVGQNRISASLDASGEGIRYYMPIKRRSAENFPLHFEQTGVPPTTPAVAAQQSKTPPLPPIKAKSHT